MALNPIAEDAAIAPEDADEVNPLRGFIKLASSEENTS